MLDVLWQIGEALIHLSPASINELAHLFGPWLYVILFAIIFAETGLVITPFLPGDSLLFAAGAVTAVPGSPVHLPLLATLLIIAAIIGDAVNYTVGHFIGPKVFTGESSRLLNRKHLMRAHEFYEKYGGVTIILARFIPIVRTFAPFVAGIGKMHYPRFAFYNVTGAFIWVLLFLVGGWWFGGLESVQKNFKLVIVAIIFISILPGFVEFFRARAANKRAAKLAEASIVGEESAAG